MVDFSLLLVNLFQLFIVRPKRTDYTYTCHMSCFGTVLDFVAYFVVMLQ